MEKEYNDELLPENFEQIAKAYSKSLKDKGFIFIRLDEEEYKLLISEVFVLLAKMRACCIRLDNLIDSSLLKCQIDEALKLLYEKFGTPKIHLFKCVEDENLTFLSLVGIENLLIIKLMILSVKSGELETCNKIIASISSIFAESFPAEGFVLDE